MTRGQGNSGATTLSAAYTAGSGVLSVNSTVGCPAVPFVLKVESELLLVTGVPSRTQFQVNGGQESTTPANHGKNVSVRWGILTAQDMQQLQIADQQAQVLRYVRPPTLRAYIAANFN